MDISDFRKRKLSALFDAFDGDHDGVLTDEDPRVIIQHLVVLGGLEPGSQGYENFEMGFMAYWKDFVMTSDLDRDGKVTLDEWYRYHETMLDDDKRFQSTVAMSVAVMFALVDDDHDGAITLAQYGQWLRAWQVDADAVTPELLSRLDIGNNGKLTQAQLMSLTREFFYTDDPNAPGNWCMGPF